MSSIQRQRVVWSGFPGGPGLSTFYFGNAAAAQTALHDFLAEYATTSLPPDVTLHIEPGGDVIDDTNGVLTAVWAGSLQTDIVGVGAAKHAGPAGVLIRWETLTIRNGSRLRGRTYMVPCTADQFDSTDGTLAPTAAAGIATLANNFVGAVTPNMLVWQRPRLASAQYTDGRGKVHKGLTARLGSSAPVVSASVPDLVAVLRSRRD